MMVMTVEKVQLEQYLGIIMLIMGSMLHVHVESFHPQKKNKNGLITDIVYYYLLGNIHVKHDILHVPLSGLQEEIIRKYTNSCVCW